MTMDRRRWVIFVGFLLLAALPAIAVWVDNPFLLTFATRVLIYAIAAAALDLIVGYGGLVSLGHAAFFGIGAYTVGILTHHASEGTAIPFLPGAWSGSLSAFVQFPLAILAAGGMAAAIGALCLRTRGVFFIMITLAFAQMLYFFMISLPTYGGEDGLNIWDRSTLPGLDLYDDTTLYYVTFGFLIGSLWLLRKIVRSRFGMVLQAARQNETRLISLGVPVTRYRLIAFTIAGAFAGLAGALMANLLEFVGPGLMHWTRSGEFLIIVILGGLGSLFGPVAGAAVLLGLEEVLASYTDHWGLILGPILIAVVLFARGGIWGAVMRGAKRDD